MKQLIILLALAPLVLGCDADVTNADKGSEDAALTGGKADSFFSPTEHGDLGFSVTNQASVDDLSQFHAWTFTLTGDATFNVRTEISKNLDTVMYVYHRASPDERWGSFIEKNDDFDGNLWSQVEIDGEAGEYRILVKPFKTSMRGDFDVIASCEGAGCPNAGAGSCEPDDFEALPKFGDLTEGCAAHFVDILVSEVEFKKDTEVQLSRKCDLTHNDLRAVDYYHSWWDDIVGFEDAFGLSPGEDMDLEVTANLHDAGETIDVDGFGDEDAMTFVFDRDDNLVASYQHNQSPTVDWFCPADGTPKIEPPSEDCVSTALFSLPHGDEVIGEAGVASAESDDVDGRVLAAVTRFASTHGLADHVDVTYDAELWESVDFDFGGKITVSAAGETATLYVAQSSFGGGTEIIAETDAKGTRFVCE